MPFSNQKSIAVIGGGAAGFFAAIATSEANPNIHVHIFEKGSDFLNKVKISGGGRCNVTHRFSNVESFIGNYPRGYKELQGPFYTFNPIHTEAWFTERQVPLKTETDGRMFPLANTSQAIIDCFMAQVEKNGISLYSHKGIKDIEPLSNSNWKIHFSDGGSEIFDALIVTTGSSNAIWHVLNTLGHTIIDPVPSLFTFNCKDERIEGLMGVSVPNALCFAIVNPKTKIEGPLLITHWGLSGPAILKLSAFNARFLHDNAYRFELNINFIAPASYQTCVDYLMQQKYDSAKKNIHNTVLYNLPSRLLKSLYDYAGIAENIKWADVSKETLKKLGSVLTESIFSINGKSIFKEEFVTSGGIKLSEVDFKTMQSKLHKNLYFAGEVLDIDAVTGGFNFQAAWTTAYIAAQAAAHI